MGFLEGALDQSCVDILDEVGEEEPPPGVLAVQSPNFRFCKSEVGDRGWDCAKCDVDNGALPCSKYLPYKNESKHLARNCKPQHGYWLPCSAGFCYETPLDEMNITGECVEHRCPHKLDKLQLNGATRLWKSGT